VDILRGRFGRGLQFKFLVICAFRFCEEETKRFPQTGKKNKGLLPKKKGNWDSGALIFTSLGGQPQLEEKIGATWTWYQENWVLGGGGNKGVNHVRRGLRFGLEGIKRGDLRER